MASVMKQSIGAQNRGSRSTSRGGGNRGKGAASAEKYKIGGATLAQTGKAHNFERIDEEEDKNQQDGAVGAYEDMGSGEDDGKKGGAGDGG